MLLDFSKLVKGGAPLVQGNRIMTGGRPGVRELAREPGSGAG